MYVTKAVGEETDSYGYSAAGGAGRDSPVYAQFGTACTGLQLDDGSLEPEGLKALGSSVE